MGAIVARPTDNARSRHDGDGFVEAAEAMRNAIDTALDDPDLTISEARVLLALVRDVGSWSRLWDHRTRRDIAALAGVSERSGTRALSRLAHLGVVLWEPSDVRGRPSKVGFLAPVGETQACLPNAAVGETEAVSYIGERRRTRARATSTTPTTPTPGTAPTTSTRTCSPLRRSTPSEAPPTIGPSRPARISSRKSSASCR